MRVKFSQKRNRIVSMVRGTSPPPSDVKACAGRIEGCTREQHDQSINPSTDKVSYFKSLRHCVHARRAEKVLTEGAWKATASWRR